MSLFNQILNNIKEKYDSENSYKEIIISSIFEVIKYKIDPDSLNLNNGVLKININPSVKTLIILKKDIILDNLKNRKVSVFEIK